MRMYDFAPLSRSSIGFDRMFDLLNSRGWEEQDDYPPYDIIRTGEETYRIALAVAGFSEDEISITAQQNMLTVSGQKQDTAEQEFLHRGIAARPFEHKFSLEDHVEVEGASYENGLLQIDLVRRVPEVMKPRRISIGAGGEIKEKRGASREQLRAAS